MKIPNNWTFEDEEVAAGFDRHVREQLPWYDLATQMIGHFGRYYIKQSDGIDHSKVYDIGASTGNIGRVLEDTLKARSASFTAIEQSEEMAKYYKGPDIDRATFLVKDATDVDFVGYDFAVMFLTLMFIDPNLRFKFVERLMERCLVGGALIIVDKFIGPPGYVGTVLNRLTMATKLNNGVSAEEIIEKELSLAGIQRPVDFETEIPRPMTEIFRYGEFQGYLYEAK